MSEPIVIRATEHVRSRHRATHLDTSFEAIEVPTVFLFHKRLDWAALLDALPKALSAFPVMTSRLVREGGALYFDCANQGVVVSERDSDQTVADIAANPIAFADLVVDRFRARKNARSGGPLITIRYTRLGQGGSALGSCFHHAIGDMQSFMTFMRAWTTVANGGELPPALCVEDRPGYLDKAFPAGGGVEPAFRQLSVIEALRFLGYFARGGRGLRSVRIYMTTMEVDAMRVAWEKEAGTFLSANDVLSAHLFDVLRRADGRHQRRRRSLAISVNYRKHMKLPPNLVGNLVSCVRHTSDAEEPASTVAAALRDGVEHFADRHFDYHATNRFVESIGGPAKLSRCVPLAFDPLRRTVFITNVCRFGVYDIEFGDAKPFLFAFVGESWLPWICALGEGFEGNGYLFTFCVPRSVANNLQRPEVRRAIHRFRDPDERLPEAVTSLPTIL